MSGIEGVIARGHTSFKEGTSTLDHILTLSTLIEQVNFGMSMSLLLFCSFQIFF